MAASRGRDPLRFLGMMRRARADLLRTTALQAAAVMVLAVPAVGQPAPNATPQGGVVVAGGATISQSGNSTTINQATQRAAINWRSFNVGAQSDVTFRQPSTAAVALNRVVGPDPSQIAGRITANGQVVLINQAGVTFYKGAQVNAQGLIVTTANVNDANFMAGRMTFDQAGNPNAQVVNQGTITVKESGLAALVAPSVANRGVINARMGHVVLAGAKTATLDLYGDGLLSLDVTNQVTQAPIGPDGKTVAALVTNEGLIRADGGTVQLTATAADGVLRRLVRAGGTIAADTVGGHTGTVTVEGIGGSVTVTGLASAAGGSGKAGAVAINATGTVTLADTARIDASGAAGGGTVAIGTTLARARVTPTLTSPAPAARSAAAVRVRRGAVVTASATGAGDGGRVTVLSRGTTTMFGTITATGGGLTGDGGLVEVSGPTLSLGAAIDVRAPGGRRGTILLDPTDLDIIATRATDGSQVDGAFTGGTLPSTAPDGSPRPSTVGADTINLLGQSGDVVIQASGNIDVRAPLNVNNGSLTIQAGDNLTIEQGASVQGMFGVLLQAGSVVPTGGLVIRDVVQSITGAVTLMSGTGGILLNGPSVSAATTIDLNTTGGGVTQDPTGILFAGTLRSSQGVAGDVSLTGANNIFRLADFAVSASGAQPGNFTLNDSVSFGVFGQVATPTGDVWLQSSDLRGIRIESGAGITTGASGHVAISADSFGFLDLISDVPTGTPGTITTRTFELAPFTSGGTIVLGPEGSLLQGDLNQIVASGIRLGEVTAPAGATSVVTAAAITVSDTIDLAGRNLRLDATGTIDGQDGPLINVATLSGSGGAEWSLTNAANGIAALGDITASDVQLRDAAPAGLTIGGTVTVTGGVAINGGSGLSVTGAVSGPAIQLRAGSIDLPGRVDAGAGYAQIVATLGTIQENGTLIAGLLMGSAVGDASFMGASATANQIGTLGTVTPLILAQASFQGTTSLSGLNLAVRSGSALTVGGSVGATGAPGQVYLTTVDPAGITVAASGSVVANATSGTISLSADRFANAGSVSAGTVELAPVTAGGTVTLGATGTGLSLVSGAGITANTLVIGAVTRPGDAAPTTSAGGIVIGGAFGFPANGTLLLDAASATATGATGAVTQTAPLTGNLAVGGTADSVTLTDPANVISAISGLTATAGDVAVVSTVALFSLGAAAPAGSIYLQTSDPNGVILIEPMTALTRISIRADALSADGGGVDTGLFELAPFTNGLTMTVGALTGTGLVLPALDSYGINAGAIRLGAVTAPGGGAPVISAGAVMIAGALDGAPTPVALLELDAAPLNGASGLISQTAPILNLPTVNATGANITLTNGGNQIGASTGMTATVGDIALVDGVDLALTGTYSGANLFFEVALAGGTLIAGAGGAATMTPAAGGRLSLVADVLGADVAGAIGGDAGTIELAPFSGIDMHLAGAGTGAGAVSATLLSSLASPDGTLLVGAATDVPNGGFAPTTRARAIALDGPIDLTGRAGTLALDAGGSITQDGGPLIVSTLTARATGDISLTDAGNQIGVSTGIHAIDGDVIFVDSTSLLLTGAHVGDSLFYEVTQAGGTLALGTDGLLLAGTGGRISLVADRLTVADSGEIVAQRGILELAPFSPIAESVLGTADSGRLVIGPSVLAALHIDGDPPNRLVIGGYTHVLADAVDPVASASAVTLDDSLSLLTIPSTLTLLSQGSVTQTAGALAVETVNGVAGGDFSLTSPENQIDRSSGITAGGALVLVDGVDLVLSGRFSGANLFVEIASPGGALRLGGTEDAILTAADGGRVSLVADAMSETEASAITAMGGTLELAPYSAIATSLFVPSIIVDTSMVTPDAAGPAVLALDQTMASIITPGLATLVVGGFTNAPAGASGPAPSAASVSIDGTVTIGAMAATLDLEALGAVTQAAPILGVGTLTGATGSTLLDNPANTIAVLGDFRASGGFTLADAGGLVIAGTLSAGPRAAFAVNGALTETGTIAAGVLDGTAVGEASLTGANSIGAIDRFAVAGTASRFALDTSGDLLINRALSAGSIAVSAPSGQITLADGAVVTTGGNTRPAGALVTSLLPQNGAAGALFRAASFVQTGVSTVNGISAGGPATLQISVTGDMHFDPPDGLYGANTWLVLNLNGGVAAGDIYVRSLDVIDTGRGRADLGGTISGISGPSAARLGAVRPGPAPAYLFNDCEIGGPVCGQITALQSALPHETVIFVPLDALLAQQLPPLIIQPEDEDDLQQMPVVPRRDY